jgi:transglutaminase-like putative cysteine protease
VIGPCADIADALCADSEATPQERLALLDAEATRAARESAIVRRFATVPANASEHERATILLDRVHRLVTYKPDPEGRDVFREIEWTIANGGDCEDLSALFVAMCRTAGLAARLVWLEQQSYAALNHVTAQVLLSDGAWHWADASLPNAQLGQHPYDVPRNEHTNLVFGAYISSQNGRSS